LKNKFQKKLLDNFKKAFFNLKDYNPEDDFYGDERDNELENGIYLRETIDKKSAQGK
jgi:hypothetical protein